MEQDWGESVFLMCSGLAKVRTFTADGDEVVMSVLGSGDVFGEMAAIDGAPRSADVVALTPLRLVKMRAAPFSELLKEQPSFSLALAQLMASRLRNLNQRFALQSGLPQPACSTPWPFWRVRTPRMLIRRQRFLPWPKRKSR